MATETQAAQDMAAIVTPTGPVTQPIQVAAAPAPTAPPVIVSPGFVDEEPDYGLTAAAPAATTPPAAATAAATPPPVAPTFTPDILARAQSLGLTAEEAQAYGDPAHLERTLNVFERNLAQIGRQSRETVPPQQQQQPPATLGDQANKQLQATQQQDAGDFKLTLKEDDYDPQIIAAFKGMNEHYKKQVDALKGQLEAVAPNVQSLVRRQQEQVRDKFVSDFDGWLAGLGDEFTEILGKEPVTKLTPGSPTEKNRQSLIQEMDALVAGYRATGRPVPETKELFNRATRLLYGDAAREAAGKRAREQAAAQVRNRSGQFVAQPTHRTGAPETGVGAAVRSIHAKLRDMDFGPGSYDVSERDGLLP